MGGSGQANAFAWGGGYDKANASERMGGEGGQNTENSRTEFCNAPQGKYTKIVFLPEKQRKSIFSSQNTLKLVLNKENILKLFVNYKHKVN